MKIKISEATNNQLNWLVAKCEGNDPVVINGVVFECDENRKNRKASYATSWEQAGPIIARECLSIDYCGERTRFGQHIYEEQFWGCYHPSHRTKSRRTAGYASTPLVAAMRCYIASKLGAEIEIPEELQP